MLHKKRFSPRTSWGYIAVFYTILTLSKVLVIGKPIVAMREEIILYSGFFMLLHDKYCMTYLEASL